MNRIVREIWEFCAGRLLFVKVRRGERLGGLGSRFQLGCPMRQVVERRFVRSVKLQRGYGNGPVKNRGVIALRIEPFDVFLFEQPEIAAAARVGALLQNIARDFL